MTKKLLEKTPDDKQAVAQKYHFENITKQDLVENHSVSAVNYLTLFN